MQKSLSNLTLFFIITNNYIQEYSKILAFITLSFIIAFLMLTIAYLLSLNNLKDAEKLSEYECKFEPFDSATRHPFDIHFYVVSILFLILDVEIAILFP